MSGQNLGTLYDPFFIFGGPLFISRPTASKTYELKAGSLWSYFFSQFDRGLYEDYSALDVEEIKTNFAGLGP
jgi:hypothetical protein